MEIFKTDSVASLQKESAGVMSVFEKTITKIDLISDKINAAISKRDADITKHEALVIKAREEKDDLQQTQEKNQRFANKLMTFLEA